MRLAVSSVNGWRCGTSYLRVSPHSLHVTLTYSWSPIRVFHIGLNTEPSTFVLGTSNDTLTGTTIFGPSTFYAFSINFPSSTGLLGLRVQGYNMPFQDSMFVVPSLSSISPGFNELSVIDPETYTINITTAVSRTNDPVTLDSRLLFRISKHEMCKYPKLMPTLIASHRQWYYASPVSHCNFRHLRSVEWCRRQPRHR